MSIRNRIKAHVRVKARELVPHELNPRRHPESQRAALAAIYAEVGFARSLLAYELPDGRLKLIDGHLRAAMDPEQEVEVEVLDVSDSEARALILSLDPLAQLAEYDDSTLAELRRLTTTEHAALSQLWESLDQATARTDAELRKAGAPRPNEQDSSEQFLVLVECSDEQNQVALLERLRGEGFACKALLS